MKKICKIYPILAKYFLSALCAYWVEYGILISKMELLQAVTLGILPFGAEPVTNTALIA